MCFSKTVNLLFISSDTIIILFPNIVAGTKNTKKLSTQKNWFVFRTDINNLKSFQSLQPRSQLQNYQIEAVKVCLAI